MLAQAVHRIAWERDTVDPRSADPIQAFYNAHPYPPPVADLDRVRERWRDPDRRRAEFHLLWPDRPCRTDIDILVAGCGTSQAARHALCWPNARVTGIDVSAQSLEETRRLKDRYGLHNLAIRMRAIEDAAGLERQFDLIVCTGVVHHLADPGAGLRALRSVLKPGGVIHLMVYAPYGRTGIYMLQDYARRLGIGTSKSEIEELVRVVEALPWQHPLMAVLGQSRDFLDPDAVADALLNPRDRAYSVPQLYGTLADNGLSLARWYRQAPYLPQCGAIAETAHAARIAALEPAAQYAAMELWRGAMATHSLVVRRDDEEAGAPVGFDDERWRDYVPLRMPSTGLERDRAPAGAVGLLFNRSHRFHDIVLPVGPDELALLQAIDGHRSMGGIVDKAIPGSWDVAQRFFRALWHYDQIVVDASNARASR
ncbi:class I SAM-dependent methyltransferase [Novilysobacter selenitireducens]|uniref:Class I SAM-dependent methyltransferase n=1 Tax=Novilysobacter selenitireducens TaxID=2872639 RepID=A0ABS7T5F7_9GAMM|nr:class I SAM-dependent methyltransferase [Lysobacter selenitireducens]MBZ4039111.1 class I SAM-dependent methyltransferase [Lysobacter selenitireducens]